MREKSAKKVEGKYTDQIKTLEDDIKARDESIAVFREQEQGFVNSNWKKRKSLLMLDKQAGGKIACRYE